jgi:hypothetical protein
MITSINEYNLKSENWEKYYYLVLKLNGETIDNLLKGELKGLKGISDNVKIIDAFFDIRDILLIMNKDEVEKLNKIEKIDYDDVNLLTNNNFKVFKRMSGSENSHIESIIYQGFRKLESFNSYKKYANDRLIKLYKLFYEGKLRYLLNWMDNNSYKIIEKIGKVKNFKDFVNKIWKSVKEKIGADKDFATKEQVSSCLELILLNYANMFKREGEILIRSRTFKIPENSTLLIKEPQQYDGFLDDGKFDFLKKNKNKLKKKFKLKILPKLSDPNNPYMGATHKQARPIVRYLDKIKSFENFNQL